MKRIFGKAGTSRTPKEDFNQASNIIRNLFTQQLLRPKDEQSGVHFSLISLNKIQIKKGNEISDKEGATQRRAAGEGH